VLGVGGGSILLGCCSGKTRPWSVTEHPVPADNAQGSETVSHQAARQRTKPKLYSA
jgi:hypothetical protein